MKAWLIAFLVAGGWIARGTCVTQLKSFGTLEGRGFPSSRLIMGPDGNWYGSSARGGHLGGGAVYRLSLLGNRYKAIHSFNPESSDGFSPLPVLARNDDGTLYGLTQSGGPRGGGALFTVHIDGTEFQSLYHFSREVAGTPDRGLLVGLDGRIYGSHSEEPTAGMVYALDPESRRFSVLHDFGLPGSTESHPGSILQARDGKLYGTAIDNQIPWSGVIYSLSTNGAVYRVVSRFPLPGSTWPPTVRNPRAWLSQSSDGVLYGAASPNDPDFGGVLFRFNPDGSQNHIIHTFGASHDNGNNPMGELLIRPDGILSGVTSAGGTFGLGTVFQLGLDGTGFQILHAFVGGADGQRPSSGMAFASDGILYGTAGAGAVFRVRPDGNDYYNIWPDDSRPSDGQFPTGGWVFHPGGFFLGTTSRGGKFGLGTVFRMGRDGSGYATLHDFDLTEGSPAASSPLVLSDDLILYGMVASPASMPTTSLYRIGADGTGFQLLRTHFSGVPYLTGGDGHLYGLDSMGLFRCERDGGGRTNLLTIPGAHLLRMGQDHYLYTTARRAPGEPWQILRLRTDGGDVSVFHAATETEGRGNVAGLTQSRDGHWYITTAPTEGRCSGTIVRVDPDGSHATPLHEFDPLDSMCGFPAGGVTEGRDGHLYGVAQSGTDGSVYRLKPSGAAFAWIYKLGSHTNGLPLIPELIAASDGAVYGLTKDGGVADQGSLFRIAPDAVLSPLPDLIATNGLSFTFTLPTNALVSLDGLPILNFQTLGLPPGIEWNGSSRLFHGVPTQAGWYPVTLIARTDCGQDCTLFITFRIRVWSAGEPFLTAVDPLAPGGVQILGIGIPGQTYRVESGASASGGRWTPVGLVVPGADGHFVLNDPAGADQTIRLYRAVIP